MYNLEEFLKPGEQLIFATRFGSHLYGTNTEKSDTDLKGIFLPAMDDLILQRPRQVISFKTKTSELKNSSDDTDVELYSLQKFVNLLAEGQVVAYDILFSNKENWIREPQYDIFNVIKGNLREHILNKNSASFIGYCRQQANKYGIKGSRVAVARAAKSMLESLILSRMNPHEKLSEVTSFLEEFVSKHKDHSNFYEIDGQHGSVLHFEICNRKMPVHVTIKYALDLVTKIVDSYGDRALRAELNDGIDWKAMSHAVRVGRQSIDIFENGGISFPLPYAPHLLHIKLGLIDYSIVSQEIEFLLEEVEKAATVSNYRDEPDRQWIDQFLVNILKLNCT